MLGATPKGRRKTRVRRRSVAEFFGVAPVADAEGPSPEPVRVRRHTEALLSACDRRVVEESTGKVKAHWWRVRQALFVEDSLGEDRTLVVDITCRDAAAASADDAEELLLPPPPSLPSESASPPSSSSSSSATPSLSSPPPTHVQAFAWPRDHTPTMGCIASQCVAASRWLQEEGRSHVVVVGCDPSHVALFVGALLAFMVPAPPTTEFVDAMRRNAAALVQPSHSRLLANWETVVADRYPASSRSGKAKEKEDASAAAQPPIALRRLALAFAPPIASKSGCHAPFVEVRESGLLAWSNRGAAPKGGRRNAREVRHAEGLFVIELNDLVVRGDVTVSLFDRLPSGGAPVLFTRLSFTTAAIAPAIAGAGGAEEQTETKTETGGGGEGGDVGEVIRFSWEALDLNDPAWQGDAAKALGRSSRTTSKKEGKGHRGALTAQKTIDRDFFVDVIVASANAIADATTEAARDGVVDAEAAVGPTVASPQERVAQLVLERGNIAEARELRENQYLRCGGVAAHRWEAPTDTDFPTLLPRVPERPTVIPSVLAHEM